MPIRDFRWIGPHIVEKVPTNIIYIVRKLNTNKTQILHRIRLQEIQSQKKLLKAIIRKLNGRLAIISLFHKLIYIPLHGKRNLVDTYLTFLSCILSLTQFILMEVKHRDQILLLSRAPIFKIQAMVKIEKLAPLLTHLHYNFQNLNRMAEVKTLRPLQAELKMIIPSKHPSQPRTLKLHMNLSHNRHRDRVITLQRLRSTILLSKLPCRMNLVILEAATTTYALILTLSTQKNAETDVCKILIHPLFVRHF